MQKLLTFFFSKNISVYARFNDQSFNNTLTNDIVSFEQLGPDDFLCSYSKQFPKYTNLLIYSAELPELYIWTTSSIKVDKKHLRNSKKFGTINIEL